MLIVAPIDAVAEIVATEPVARIIGLLGPQIPHPVLPSFDDNKHLKLALEDTAIAAEDLTAPQAEHVTSLIEFAERWHPGEGPMLIHCMAGVSRSTAAAFIIMCLLNPQEEEADLATELRQLSPTANPNRMLVALGDILLKRNGKMIEAVDLMGKSRMAFEGQVFRWNPIR